MYDENGAIKQTMINEAVKLSLVNDFNEFLDAYAIILLIGPILLARTWNGKLNCLKRRGSQLKRRGCQQALKI